MKIDSIILSIADDNYSNLGCACLENGSIKLFNPNSANDRLWILAEITSSTRIIDERIGELKFSDFAKNRSKYTQKIVKDFKQSGRVYDPTVQGVVTAMIIYGDEKEEFRVILAFAFGGVVDLGYSRRELDPYLKGINGYTYIWDKRVFYIEE